MFRKLGKKFIVYQSKKSIKSNGHFLYHAVMASVVGATAISNCDSEVSLARRNSMRIQKKHYPYVIVGAGTSAQAAIEAIRQSEPNAEILLLSDEKKIPRDDADWRQNDGQIEPISDSLMDTYNEWRRHATSNLANEPDAYSSTPVTLLLGRKDMHFDIENKKILLQDGTQVSYDKCLLANAGKPRNFYVLDSNRISYTLKDRINTCTTISDFRRLDGILKNTNNERDGIMNVTVVGGGFLGSEIATSLATKNAANDDANALSVQQVFVESYPLSRYVPEYLAKDIKKRMEHAGIEVISDRLVTSIKGEEDSAITISALGDVKQKISTDYVALCSTHIDPNVQLAKESCLEIDEKNNGIVVNAQLEAIAGLYVAGNLASFYDPSLGRRRVDMYDHAVNSGLVAGRNMVASKHGKAKSYAHQPMFRSNMEGIDLLLQGVGTIDANLTTTGVWLSKSKDTIEDEQYHRGIVYYLKAGKIVGILLWNAPDLIEAARHLLIAQPDIIRNDQLKTAISIGPDQWLHLISQ